MNIMTDAEHKDLVNALKDVAPRIHYLWAWQHTGVEICMESSHHVNVLLYEHMAIFANHTRILRWQCAYIHHVWGFGHICASSKIVDDLAMFLIDIFDGSGY